MPGENAMIRTPFFDRWFAPGLIVAIVSGCLSLGTLLLLSGGTDGVRGGVKETRDLALLSVSLTLAVAMLGWAIKETREHTEKRIENASSKLEDELKTFILYGPRPSSASLPPHLAFVRKEVLKRASRVLKNLDSEGTELPNVDACATALIDEVGKSGTQGVYAICGNKAWGDGRVKKYYDANYRLGRAGAPIKRLFIQGPSGRFPEDEKKVVVRHFLENKDLSGIEARLVPEGFLHEIGHLQFPEGFGFAVLNGVVIVHWGMMNPPAPALLAYAGRRFTDAFIVDAYRQVFNDLWNAPYVERDWTKIKSMLSIGKGVINTAELEKADLDAQLKSPS